MAGRCLAKNLKAVLYQGVRQSIMINLWIKELKKIADKKTFFVTFFSVILIHGEMIFNKISFHDDITYAFIPLQRMEVHGRWLFAWILKLINTISASESLPVVNAAVCAVFIALTAGMILDLFCINNVYCRFGMIIIFASIPSVAGHFGYMISAPFDFFGKLLCVFAAYILCKFGNSVGTFIVSIIFLACSLG